MVNIGTMRAWYPGGFQYIYWQITQLDDPVFDYPTGSPGYPDVADLIDFTLINNNTIESLYNPTLCTAYWDGYVADGYVVGITSSGAPNYYNVAQLSAAIIPEPASEYATRPTVYPFPVWPESPPIFVNFPKQADGVATTIVNKVKTCGTYSAWCDSTAEPGEQLFVSLVHNGMVSRIVPVNPGEYIIFVGIANEYKASSDPGRINIIIRPELPIEIP